MGWKNKEKEVKLRLETPMGYGELCRLVERVAAKCYKDYDTEDDTVIGKATDIYWQAPKAGSGHFVRLRRLDSGNNGQITLKSTNEQAKNKKIKNLDRVEIDLDVDYRQGKALMCAAHGKELGAVTKKYKVFFLEDDHVNFSVYQVSGDPSLYVEVEAKTLARVKTLIKKLLAEAGPAVKWSWIQSSIFEMYVLKKKPKVAKVASFIDSKG